MTWYKTDNPHIPVNVPVIVAIVNNYGAREATTAYWDASYWRNDKGLRLINRPYAWAYFPTPPDPEKIS